MKNEKLKNTYSIIGSEIIIGLRTDDTDNFIGRIESIIAKISAKCDNNDVSHFDEIIIII